MSVQLLELSEVSDLRWDGARELILSEPPEELQVEMRWHSRYFQWRMHNRTKLAAEGGCRAEAGWYHSTDSRRGACAKDTKEG